MKETKDVGVEHQSDKNGCWNRNVEITPERRNVDYVRRRGDHEPGE